MTNEPLSRRWPTTVALFLYILIRAGSLRQVFIRSRLLQKELQAFFIEEAYLQQEVYSGNKNGFIVSVKLAAPNKTATFSA